MPFIRNITTDQTVVSLLGGRLSLEFGETARINSTILASTEVQDAITAGDIKEVPSLNYIEGNIKGSWDMATSTVLPPGAQPGYMYTVTSTAIHPTSGDSFSSGDIAIISADGLSVRNMTRNPPSAGSGGSGQYTWVQVSSTYNIKANEYALADSSGTSFSIILPSGPSLGTTVGVYPSTNSFTTNPVTVLRNGSLIQSAADDILLDDNIGITLIYVGGTVGWFVMPLDDTVVFLQNTQADSYYTIVNIVGDTYTCVASDSGKILLFDTANAVTLTVPEFATEPLPSGYYVSFRNKQGAAITLTTEGTDVIEGAGTVTNDSTKLNVVYLESPGTPNTWVSVGDLA